MTDAGLKKILGVLLRNKDLAMLLLDSFKPEDIEKGILTIPETMLTRDFKMLIMDKTSPYLNDYNLMFQQNSIYGDLDVNAKQLGRLKAKLMLTFSGFDFHKGLHRIMFTYKEDLKAEGNLVQNMAVKAAGLKGSYLQTVAEMAKLSFVEVTKDMITISLDLLDFAEKIPPSLNIEYISCEDGMLKFFFHIEE